MAKVDVSDSELTLKQMFQVSSFFPATFPAKIYRFRVPRVCNETMAMLFVCVCIYLPYAACNLGCIEAKQVGGPGAYYWRSRKGRLEVYR